MLKKIIIICFIVLGLALAADAGVNRDIDSTLFISPRITALGMTGAALGYGSEAIFLNPAMLAKTKKINTFLASYVLLEDINHLNGAVTFPFGRGAFGIGYKSKKTDGINVVSYADLDVNGRPVESMVDDATFTQEVYTIGLGWNILENNSFVNSLDIGLGIKSFSLKSAGTSKLQDFSASGYDMDFGIYSDITDVWSLGVTWRNFLAGGGGMLFWKNGYSESIAETVVVGNKFYFYHNNLNLLFDAEIPNDKAYPVLFRGGLEVKPYTYLALRFGVHQYAYPIGSSYKLFNGVTGGFSIIPLKDFNIEYAYYPGDGYYSNALHYAGISFDSFDVFKPSSSAASGPVEYTFKINQPNDYLVTFQDSVTLDITVQDSKTITINKQVFPVDAKEKALRNFKLRDGYNEIEVQYQDRVNARKIYKLANYKTLIKNKQDKDIRKLIYTDQFNNDSGSFSNKINFLELADYIVNSAKLTLPEKLPTMFNSIDVLYFKGYLGRAELMQEDLQTVTKGKLATILARLEGYDYVFSELPAEQWPNTAVETLAQTGSFRTEEFYPLDSEVTAREAILLLAKTSIVNQATLELYQDFPMVYLDSYASGNIEEIDLHMINAEKFNNVKLLVNNKEENFSINARNNYVQGLAYSMSSKGNTIALVIEDKYGNNYTYNLKGASPANATGSPTAQKQSNEEDELFLIKLTPKNVYPGQQCKIELAVPARVNFSKAILSSSLLDNNIYMNQEKDFWVATININAGIRPGTYSLAFNLTRSDGQQFIKTYPLQVSGLKVGLAKRTIDNGENTYTSQPAGILIKTNQKSVRHGDVLDIYVGVMRNPETVQQITITFGDGETVKAQQTDRILWKAKKLIPSSLPAGENYYKVYIKDKSGSTQEKKMPLVVIKKQATAAAPTAKKPAAAVNTSTNPYAAEIYLKPTTPKKGSALLIKAKTGAIITKVSGSAFNKTLTFQKDETGLWASKVIIPVTYTAKTATLKVIAKDKKGAFKTTLQTISIQ